LFGAGSLGQNHFWDMLELPKTISIKGSNGVTHKDIPMWHYWMLTEGVLRVDPNFLKTDDGKMPPVIHVDTDAPLYSDSDKNHLITDKLWGIYYKPDFHFGGIQGGSSPYKVGEPGGDGVNVDPYGTKSKDFIITDEFVDMWTSALAFCHKRFEGKSHLFKKDGGGLGCFTPDCFPVFDQFRENVYMIADSNHGYKMIGVGKLVAEEVLGDKSSLLEPFRFSRYVEGNLHPTSNSPFPWS